MVIFDFNRKEYVMTGLSRLGRIQYTSFLLLTKLPFQ